MTRPTRESRLLRDTRIRLLAWSGGSTLVVLAALGLALNVAVSTSLSTAAEAKLRERAAFMQSFVERGPITLPPGVPSGGPIATVPSDVGFVIGGATSGTAAVILGSNVPAIEGSRAEALGSVGLPDQAGYEAALAGETTIREVEVNDIPGRILSVPLVLGGETFVVQVFADRVAEEETLATLRSVLTLGGLAVLAAALAVGWFYAGRALVPIRHSLARQREFAADASHELRTPLAIVRSGVEELRQAAVGSPDPPHPAIDDIEAGATRLGSLVDDLLFLARADSGALVLERAAVDLGEVVADALAELAGMAQAAGVRLSLAAAPTLVTGDARRLAQLTAILVDNAIRHGRPGGTVEVSVGAIEGQGQAELIVADNGPGIPAAELAHVFDRFWRARNAPSGGTGLGLAIATWIVEGHGGTIEAANRPEGGARFVARLPLRRGGD
ncbi:MAG: HAMP domain-containing sensor histidine kinase [Chloroflexota bacterium]